MTSKYDTYWRDKLQAVLDCLNAAHSSQQAAMLDLTDIGSVGDRKSWVGRLEIANGMPVYDYGAHMASLGQMLIPQLPDWTRQTVLSFTVTNEQTLVVQEVARQATTWFESAYRIAKLAETVKLAGTQLGPITATSTESVYIQSRDNIPLLIMFCTKQDGWFAPRLSLIDQLGGEGGQLVLSFTDEGAGRITLWQVPLAELVTRIQAKDYRPSLDRGKAYSLNINTSKEADLIKQLEWDIRPHRLVLSPTELTRAKFVPPVTPVSQQGSAITSAKDDVNLTARLAQWKQEAVDVAHPNYGHANLNEAVRRYATISKLLAKLRTAPDSFAKEDALLLFGTLNSGQRTKQRLVDQNPIADLRQHLLYLLYGEGAPWDKIEATTAAVRFAGTHMLGELYGWAHADTAPLYNSCATDALAYLGHRFDPADYNAFVAAHERFKLVYQEKVGHLQPDLPLNLEIDKFYNVIDKVDLKRPRSTRRLAQPFNEMFEDWEEAEWAFDLLAQAAARLGLQGPDDPMAAFNLRTIGRTRRLGLIYGGWLVMAFEGRGESLQTLILVLFSDQTVITPQMAESFSQAVTERPVGLHWISSYAVKPMPQQLLEVHLDTLDHVREVHANWTRSNFHGLQKPQIAQAVFDQTIRDRLLELGMDAPPQRFWKIAPGEDAWQWEACRQEGFIAIGWDELGDLSGIDRATFEGRCQQLIAADPKMTRAGLEQVWQFLQLQEGDQIVANRGTTKILGIGTITGPYYYVPETRHCHRFPVDWYDSTPRTVDQPGWRRTLVELDSSKFEQLAQAPTADSTESAPVKDKAFSPQTFELLAALHANPTKECYQSQKDDFKYHVEEPFQSVLRDAATLLPPHIRALMETDESIYARILKNDYGKGGAWDFYWGAFYPKGGKRTEDAQLSMWINHDRLEYGFCIGSYGSNQRRRFQSNCREHGELLVAHFREVLPESEVAFGDHGNFDVDPDGNVRAKVRLTWDDFMRNPAKASNDVSIIMPRRQVLETPRAALVQQIRDAFVRLFPLVLLAVEDNPLPVIRRFWKAQGIIEDEPQGPVRAYTRSDFLASTYFLQEDADELFEVFQEKRQVILYGPPGTGKTFVARELARWITALSDPPADRVEMIQFHPAYSYEDFIEGIRPESKPAPDGHFVVDYPSRPGVFYRFCQNAIQRPDQPHVFIIDELNRGNIARIFGELMLLLEYRDHEVPLPYSGRRFRIPPNVYLIGTMNTADRSIALVDFALRRRFHFFQFSADAELFDRWLQANPINIPYLAGLYRRLSQEAVDDPDYAVGPSYFMDRSLTESKLERIWRRSIEPYLAEYYVDQRVKFGRWRWDSDFMRGLRTKL